jgi:predicted O-linked N-acetylglucosamine transferase (SPINDLY family)
MSAKAVRAWSRVLAEVPEATLILKDPALDNPGIREAFVRRLDEAGVAEERVLLLGRTPHDQHLAVYHEIDVALDPFPNGGGVSTAEALWMGVPVVTLLGATPGGRTTASILAHAGMEDWVARTQDDYV